MNALSLGCDTEQGRRAPLPRRDPWFSVLYRYGPPGWLHAVNNDPNLVRVSSADWPSCDRALFVSGAEFTAAQAHRLAKTGGE